MAKRKRRKAAASRKVAAAVRGGSVIEKATYRKVNALYNAFITPGKKELRKERAASRRAREEGFEERSERVFED